MGERYQRSLRILSETYQAFERLSGRHVRELGLTPAQFDVIATLGNTPGMTSKALGRATLITKGTLTGVVDRLVQRGFVERVVPPEDRRSVIVRLTEAGDAEFRRVFHEHVAYCRRAFLDYAPADFDALDAHLVRMRDGFLAAARRGRRGAAGEPGPQRTSQATAAPQAAAITSARTRSATSSRLGGKAPSKGASPEIIGRTRSRPLPKR
ncbi:MAG: hypothetical protein RJA99_2663 [Pseudomonadota bacterium]|jgi:MarR family 2-MHQ and catechol resistance regulon transcriptional repressor